MNQIHRLMVKLNITQTEMEKAPMLNSKVRATFVSISNNVIQLSTKYIDNHFLFLDNYSDTLTLLVGMKLTMNQLIALMMKKILNSYRNWIMLFIQTLIPVLFALITILTVQSWGGNRNLPKLEFSLNTYSRTVTSVEVKPSLDPEGLSMKIYNSYRNQFGSNTLDTVDEDMSTHYLRKSKQFLTRLNSRYLYGATIDKKEITVWFNNQPYHTSPVSLSLVHNAILSAVAGKTCSISVSNRPIPYSADSRVSSHFFWN